MIAIDTHIWVWWVDGIARLSAGHRRALEENVAVGLGVSVVSCWEVAMLARAGRLVLSFPVDEWIDQALSFRGVRLLNLTPRIAVESTRLPGDFHRDPADRFIVATARILDCALVTADQRILDYPHVRTIDPQGQTRPRS